MQGRIPQRTVEPEVLHPVPARAPLVGRSVELARLAAVLVRVARGQGSTVFLSGEGGVGKTRLAQEAITLARARGFLVLESRAFPLESGLAYSPLLDAFRPFLGNLDSARRARLRSGLPDLGRLFTTLRLPPPEPLGDPALEKTRLFESVTRLLERMAGEQPVVLFLDDLHWADPASIELLHYLARGLIDYPVLLILSYRPEEAETARGLSPLVLSLRRSGLADELAVGRLNPEAVAALAAQVLGDKPPADVLALLDARARGTPLFVETLLADLLESGRLNRLGGDWSLTPIADSTVPRVAHDLVIERVQRLESVSRSVLELVAVYGAAAPHPILRAASGLDEVTLLAAVRRLRAAGLILETSVGLDVAYDLGHPLVQEVAYAELPEAARRRAHAACATALEATSVAQGQALSNLPVSTLERLAYHYRAAPPETEPNRAMAVLLAAGERARELHASDAAARNFGAALALVGAGRVPPATRPPLSWLFERLGEAWERVGEVAAAIGVWSEAIEGYKQAGNVEATARLHRLLALAEWDRGHFEDAQTHLATGIAALSNTAPSQELVDLLHARAIILVRLGDADGVARVADALRALADQLGSPQAVVVARSVELSSLVARGQYAAVRESGPRLLAAAAAVDAPLLILRVLNALSLVGYALGEPQVLMEYARRSRQLAQRLGAPSLEVYPALNLIQAELMIGAWDDAWRESTETLALARRVGQPRALVGALGVRSLVLALRGDLAQAVRYAAEARSTMGAGADADRNLFGGIDLVDAILALELGDAERARAVAPGLARFGTRDGDPAIIRALHAEVTALTGDGWAALDLTLRIAASDPPGVAYLAALTARAEGVVRRSLGHDLEAMDAFRRAHEGFTALSMPFEAARARLGWASLAVTSDPPSAVAAAESSLVTFDQLGALRYAERARRVLHELGVRYSAPRRPRPLGTPLSARELEVACLVAEGLTTAEIAEQLVLSPRTVTTHLDHIYARLGIRSRAVLARHVTEAGLLSPRHGIT